MLRELADAYRTRDAIVPRTGPRTRAAAPLYVGSGITIDVPDGSVPPEAGIESTDACIDGVKAIWESYQKTLGGIPEPGVLENATLIESVASAHNADVARRNKDEKTFLTITEFFFGDDNANWMKSIMDYAKKIGGTDDRYKQEFIDAAKTTFKQLALEGWPLWPFYASAVGEWRSPWQVANLVAGRIEALRAMPEDLKIAYKQLWKDYLAVANDDSIKYLSRFGYSALVYGRSGADVPTGLPCSQAELVGYAPAVAYATIAAVARNKVALDVQRATIVKVRAEKVDPTTSFDHAAAQRRLARYAQIAIEEAERAPAEESSISTPVVVVGAAATVGLGYLLLKAIL